MMGRRGAGAPPQFWRKSKEKGRVLFPGGGPALSNLQDSAQEIKMGPGEDASIDSEQPGLPS